MHPIVIYGKDKPQYNFNGSYIGGLATGINIWKSSKVGFSFEFVPYIKAADGTSRMNNFLFHPSILFALGKGYTHATRAAFETGGRYGFTPVFNKVVKRNKNTSYYICIPLPARLETISLLQLVLHFNSAVRFDNYLHRDFSGSCV